MSRALKILEAILDVSSNINNLFDNRGGFQRNVENKLRLVLNQLQIAGSQGSTMREMDSRLIEKAFSVINRFPEFKSNRIIFEVKRRNSSFAYSGASYNRRTDSIIINVNANPISAAWGLNNSVKEFISDVRATIIHEETHREQTHRRKVESPKRELSYLKTIKGVDPRGNKQFGKYLSVPEEIMSFAAETAELMLKNNDVYIAHIKDYIDNVGRTDPNFKKYLRYVVEFAIRRGMSQGEAIKRVNNAAQDKSQNPWG